MNATHALVHPQPGVTLYTGGHHAPFEPGRPVPMPPAHAAELIAAGHVRAHVEEAAPAPAAPAPEPAAPQAAQAAPSPDWVRHGADPVDPNHPE